MDYFRWINGSGKNVRLSMAFYGSSACGARLQRADLTWPKIHNIITYN